MEFSDFAFRIILLFIPGIISLLIIEKLTNHKEFKIHQILIYSLLLGFISYVFYYLILIIIKACSSFDFKFLFFNSLTNKSSSIDFSEIAYATGISIIIGFISSFLINHKVLYWIAHKTKISNKFGDIDVWSYIMNYSKVPEWVVVRDIENDLVYEGWIQAFSDSTGIDEIFLRDVKVFRNSTAKELYEIPGLYLPRKRENLVIEFPLLKFSEYINRPKKEEDKHNAKR